MGASTDQETESVLGDPGRPPNAAHVATVLGGRWALWEGLLALAPQAGDGGGTEWTFYSRKSGWVLLVKRGRLTVCTLLPTREALDVIFLFPERAVDAARRAALPPEVMERIEGARAYRSGRPFRVSVRGTEDLAAVETLIAIKTASAKREAR